MKKILVTALMIMLFLQIIHTSWALMIERPSGNKGIIHRHVGNLNTNNEASVGLGAYLYDYIPTAGPPYGADFLSVNVSMTANSRVGITYEYTDYDYLYPWMSEDRLESETKVVFENVGDDWGAWVELPYNFNFLFYGGRYRQADGSKVWVCSNGFISFDLSNSTHPYASVIPSWIDPPDALIAPLWTDLVIDNQAEIIVGESLVMPRRYLVVIWKNALHSSGKRLTFAVAIEGYDWTDEGQPYVEQGKIYVAYQNVTSIGGSLFTYGIEDHEGRKGSGKREYGSALESLNGKTILFYQNCPSLFIKRLTLEFEDQNYPNARYDIIDTALYPIGGNNIKTETSPPTPDSDRMFKKALTSTVIFLVGAGGYLLGISTFLYTAPVSLILLSDAWTGWMAYAQYSSLEKLEFKDVDTEGDTPIQRAYVKVPAASDVVVDASLSAGFCWILKTPYTEQHSLTITSKLEYYEYPSLAERSVETSVNINIGRDDNDSFGTADPVESGTYGSDPMLWLGGYDLSDFYQTSLGSGYVIKILMTPPTQQDFDLFLYNPSRTEVASSKNRGDAQESINYQTNVAGYWFIEVRHNSGQGFYYMTISKSGGGGGGGGGCPYISTWDGDKYVLDNNVLSAAEASNGADVEDYYMLEQALASQNGKYKLLLSEFEHEHSYIDQVKLLAADHESDVNIAVTPDGEILTYKNPTAAISAVDNYGNDRLSEIRLMDGDVSDPATYFHGVAGDYLVLDFGVVSSESAKFILRHDIKCDDYCIHVQVLDGSGQWQTVTSYASRSYWAVEAVDLSAYVIRNQDFMVRLFWTQAHRLDYVGLDTTKQEDYQLQAANLVSATHSTRGDVKALLIQNDSIYAELLPSEQIQLEFTLPNNTREARTYILYTEGHYYTIP